MGNDQRGRKKEIETRGRIYHERGRFQRECPEKGNTTILIETAKANLELEAQATGLLFSIKKSNDKVKMKDILGVIADREEEFEAFKAKNPTGEIL